MPHTNMKKSLMIIVYICFAAIFSAAGVYANNLADISSTETAITVLLSPGLQNVSIEISSPSGNSVYQGAITGGTEIVNLSQLSSLVDGRYTIQLSAETGKVTETQGSLENGREAKTYRLMETVNQSDIFQLVDGKIIITNIIEE